jgi:hypothetical protein
MVGGKENDWSRASKGCLRVYEQMLEVQREAGRRAGFYT